jgi:hypothetical protein
VGNPKRDLAAQKFVLLLVARQFLKLENNFTIIGAISQKIEIFFLYVI